MSIWCEFRINTGKPCQFWDIDKRVCTDITDYRRQDAGEPCCRYHPDAVELPTSDTAELNRLLSLDYPTRQDMRNIIHMQGKIINSLPDGAHNTERLPS